MRYSGDPLRDFALHDIEDAKSRERLPKCHYCGEPITEDEYYDIEGTYICPRCLKGYRRYTEDYEPEDYE